MSNWMSLPTGRKLEQPGHDPNYQGTVGVLRPATAERRELLRKRLRELHDIEGEGLHLTEKSTGEVWEVVTSHFDPIEPAASGVEAFCVRDNLIVPLRPPGWQREGESRVLGEIGGRPATPRDPMPVGGSGSTEMSRGFWMDYPRKWWQQADWETWERAGRPRVPSHLVDQPSPELGNSAVISPPGPKIAPGFTLFTKPRAGNARSRAVDALLEANGIRPRR
ncbi:MAG: hypothetical protein M3546_17060 [Actinomycetota bacterium]|nr:hypothetical protein [Actinomycetota bacterium]